MYDLTQLTLQDITAMGSALRSFGQGADSLETVADRCVQYFHQTLIDPTTGKAACALTRFFKTHAYSDLPPTLQARAANLISPASLSQDNTVDLAQSGDITNCQIPPDLKCLTLLATAGEKSEWCDRRHSKGHQAIPLISETAVSQIPMISQLIKGFGLDVGCVLAPDPHLLMALEHQTFNVFYIPTAAGSQFIPAQTEFVEPFGIKSVLGFGGMLPSGNLFAVILFSKVTIPESTASLFKTLPLNIKMAAIPLEAHELFQPLQTA